MTAERTLPHNLDAERSILGAILLHEELLPRVVGRVDADDFFRAAHRMVFQAMRDLADAHEPIDGLSVKHVLTRKNDLDAVGGPAYLFALTDGVPRSTNVEHYADIVRDLARKRALIFKAGELIEAAYTNDADTSAADLIATAQAEMFALARQADTGGLTATSVLVPQMLDVLERLQQAKGGITGVPTGFPDLDAMLCGMQPDDFIVVGGRPSMGKTAFGVNILEHVGLSGRGAIAFSLEMSKEQLMLRLLAGVGRVDMQRMRSGRMSDAEYGRLSAAMGRLASAPIHIDDGAGLTVADIAARCRLHAATQPLDFVLVDYLQLMRTPKGTRYGSREQEIASISRDLKALAKELRVPVMVLSQLSRAPEGRSDHRPLPSDLRESGSLEQDADVILFPYRASVYADRDKDADSFEKNDDGTAELIIAKQRNGPTGVVRLAYLAPYVRFESVAAPSFDERLAAQSFAHA